MMSAIHRITAPAMRPFPGAMAWLLAFAAIAAGAPAGTSRAANYPASRHGGAYMYNYYIPPAPGTTPWAPCWSPDGKWIAVAMQGSIWKIDPKTGDAAELTQSAAYASSPTWSPDGKWIVYTADHDGARIQLEAVGVASGDS